MLQEVEKVVTQNLLFDNGLDCGGMLELSSTALVQHMKKHGCKF